MRLGRLDGMRGIAACVVAFGHHGWNLLSESQIAGTHYGPFLDWCRVWGWTCVDLFFVLSGYIFAHVYIGGNGKGPLLKTRGDLADFAVARVARLYPLHLLTLLLFALFCFGRDGNTAGAFAANLAMLQGFLSPIALTFNRPSWSLTIECICYVFFVAAALAGSRALAWLTALAILWGSAMLAVHGQPGGPWVGDTFPRGFLGFFMGQALWRWRVPLARVPSWLLVIALVGGLVLDTGRWSPLLPVLLIAWPAALLLALRVPLLESAPMLWIGDRSYSIYLVHLAVINVVLWAVGPYSGGVVMMAVRYFAVVAAALLCSDLALRLIEWPARKAIRRLWQQRKSDMRLPAAV